LDKWRFVNAVLNTGTKLEATEWLRVTGVELIGGTDLDRGRGRRMEHSCDGRRESVCGASVR
jgi:hypothetical protein